ncbi:endonuclease V [Methanonatronarchaeum sp. AMET-Sl]|uniref:endonuclease V n=1 Tax=Methanonatronarchaeum sp. AMET-Sl TaxID=3037654 RepID=UPI00244E1D5C|nr:endonuclease V [Methanonatronarchaeum sp. AMET-Sl]WGI16953.1 endonuclease V [Methanonatronarchaeum sp. AMET-Sl]
MKSKDELIGLQHSIADKAEIFDDFGDIKLVGGVDQGFIERDYVVSVAVTIGVGGDLVEKSVSVRELDFPYIPGLLAFREAPSAIDALSSLDRAPDIVLVDGSGIIHPRRAGMATHIGVELDLPTIGVTKNLLCGELVSEPNKVGDCTEIRLDGDLVGYCFLTKKACNPIYVSPGHRVSPKTAVEVVDNCLDGYKLPEPIRLADQLVGEEKNNYK